MMAPNREDHQPLFDEQKSHSIGLASILEHRLYHAEKLAWRALAVVAILSCFGNLLWAFQTLRATTNDATSRDRSFYAGLERDVPIPYHDDLIFNSPNRSLADAAWLSWVIDPGIVALPNDWVNGKMLPQAQHWPWDEDKGLYLLQGFHNMHCLVSAPKPLLLQVLDLTCFSDSSARLSLRQRMAKLFPPVTALSITYTVSSLFARISYVMPMIRRAIQDPRSRRHLASCRHACARAGISSRVGREITRPAIVMLAAM